MHVSRSATLLLALVGLAAASLGPAALAAQPEPPASGGVLIIGTKEAPPFAMKGDDGQWTGISIELWREVANRLGLRYELREYDLQGLLEAVRTGQVAAGVAAVTATQEREEEMDFTHPIYSTGFGIALAPLHQPGWRDVMTRFLSLRFLGALGVLVLALVAAGSLIWAVEHRANPEHFGGRSGLFSGFWWAAVTMSTVGYGDKVPKTVVGKLIGIVWIFVTVATLGTMIASLSSAITVSQLQSPILGPEDLHKASVATIAGSTSEQYLRQNRIRFRYADNLDEALRSVAERKVDAVVYDAPLLRYLVTRDYRDELDALPRTFGRQDYCIALPTGSLLREPINRVLLADATQARLRDILFRHLEQEPPPPRPQRGE